MRVAEMASQETGLYGDWGLLCYHFDEAVNVIGSHVRSVIDTEYMELIKNHKGDLTRYNQDKYMKIAVDRAMKSKNELKQEKMVRTLDQAKMKSGPGMIFVE